MVSSRARLGAQAQAVAGQEEAEDLPLAIRQGALTAGPAAEDQARRRSMTLASEGFTGGDDFLKDAQSPDKGPLLLGQSRDGVHDLQGRGVRRHSQLRRKLTARDVIECTLMRGAGLALQPGCAPPSPKTCGAPPRRKTAAERWCSAWLGETSISRHHVARQARAPSLAKESGKAAVTQGAMRTGIFSSRARPRMKSLTA